MIKRGKVKLRRGNIHFRPQFQFCGGLFNVAKYFDFVGMVEGSHSLDDQFMDMAHKYPSLNISDSHMTDLLTSTYKKKNSWILGGGAVHSQGTSSFKDELLTDDLVKKIRKLYSRDYELIKLLQSNQQT